MTYPSDREPEDRMARLADRWVLFFVALTGVLYALGIIQ